MAGQVQVMFSPIAASLGYIRADQLRPLAVTGATRSPVLPDVPTVAEFLPGYEASRWHGIGAPKNTPADIVQNLNNEVNADLADPAFKAQASRPRQRAAIDVAGRVSANSSRPRPRNGPRSKRSPTSKPNEIARNAEEFLQRASLAPPY